MSKFVKGSVDLYAGFINNRKRSEVIKFINNLSYSVGINPLEFGDFNKGCYEKIYEKNRRKFGDNRPVLPKESFFEDIPKLGAMCKKCASHFLKEYKRKKRINYAYIKEKDVMLAKKLEDMFMDFLSNDMGIKSIHGNEPSAISPNAHEGYPDILITNMKNEKICYLEVKYNAAPYIKQNLPGRTCYEGSLTLNPSKLIRQYEMVQSGEIDIPIYYVYIADFPCIKGVFFSNINKIWKYFEDLGRSAEHDRKAFGGDFEGGRKIGQTKIIYPPLLCMNDFAELINKIINS